MQCTCTSAIHWNPTSRQHLLELWLAFIQLQANNKVTPLLFQLALKRPKLQALILPIQRLDYLAWYVNNYLHHNEDYRHAIAQPLPEYFFHWRKIDTLLLQ